MNRLRRHGVQRSFKSYIYIYITFCENVYCFDRTLALSFLRRKNNTEKTHRPRRCSFFSKQSHSSLPDRSQYVRHILTFSHSSNFIYSILFWNGSSVNSLLPNRKISTIISLKFLHDNIPEQSVADLVVPGQAYRHGRILFCWFIGNSMASNVACCGHLFIIYYYFSWLYNNRWTLNIIKNGIITSVQVEKFRI